MGCDSTFSALVRLPSTQVSNMNEPWLSPPTSVWTCLPFSPSLRIASPRRNLRFGNEIRQRIPPVSFECLLWENHWWMDGGGGLPQWQVQNGVVIGTSSMAKHGVVGDLVVRWFHSEYIQWKISEHVFLMINMPPTCRLNQCTEWCISSVPSNRKCQTFSGATEHLGKVQGGSTTGKHLRTSIST